MHQCAFCDGLHARFERTENVSSSWPILLRKSGLKGVLRPEGILRTSRDHGFAATRSGAVGLTRWNP